MDLVGQLLKKDEKQRLGYNAGAMDVMSHHFFEGMDWTMAAERRLTPPFIPKLKSPVDTKMFAPFYLN
jgi:hypothetical protein